MNPTFHISYVYHSHTGLGIGRNIGINNSRGRYITFLDDDDEYLHDHLEIRKKILKHNPEIDLLHGGVKIIGDEYVPDRYNLRQRIHLSECVIGGTFFIKKSIFDIVGGFGSDNFGDDTDFFEKVKNAGFKINKINNPTYVYYRNGPSITTNFKIES
jgi:glycosyltransferase involved in cell wall biosynthesis